MSQLRGDGHAVLLISHNFDQVTRAGRCVGGRRTEKTTGAEIVAMITGAA